MEIKEQRAYEIAFLARGEEGVGAVISHLHRLGAEIINEESARPIDLAYPIKKHTTAHFGCVHFKAEPETVKTLKESLKFEGNILRHLIITPPFLKENALPTGEQKVVGDDKRRPSGQPTGGTGLSNEDLEIKLQEISESLPE